MLDQLKLLLGINGEEQDALLHFLLASGTERVKHYCNLAELPSELESVVVRLCADLWWGKGYNRGKQPAVASVTRGDVSTHFFQPDSGNEMENGILRRYAAELQGYRKLRW